MGEQGNLTTRVTRTERMFSMGTVVVPSHRTSSQYVDVVGYDIEADGSIGTEGVPGELYRVNMGMNDAIMPESSKLAYACIVLYTHVQVSSLNVYASTYLH